MHYRSRILAAVIVLVASGACGGSAAKTAQHATAPASSALPTSAHADGERPLGLVAIGHSFLTGYDSNLPEHFSDAPENSWATGTNPKVHSIYQRLITAEPQIAGHVANLAEDGATADALEIQAMEALKVVPRPQLVIVQTIDNDIKCDGTDPANYAPFGMKVKAALTKIVSTSPQTRILVLSKLGRPASYAEAVGLDRAAKLTATGDGMCDPYDSAGHLAIGHVRAELIIIQKYEHQLATVCASVTQCHYDPTLATYHDSLHNLAVGDWYHLNVKGLGAVAALMWPPVATLLALPPR
jgi:hypothetical protein